MPPKPHVKWSEIKNLVSALPAEQQLDLIKELFDLSPQNQEFLAETLQIGGDYEMDLGRIPKPSDLSIFRKQAQRKGGAPAGQECP